LWKIPIDKTGPVSRNGKITNRAGLLLQRATEHKDQSILQQTINTAEKFFSEGRIDEAEAVCLGILEETRTDAKALCLLGLIRHQQGKNQDAVELLRQSVQEAPDFVGAHNHLGAILITMDRGREAVESLQKATAIQPKFVAAHSNLGNAFHSAGELEEAEKSYRTALTLDPKNVQANVSLGNLLRHTRKPDEAVKYFSAAIAIAPDSAMIHHFLGNAYRQSGNRDDAIASYRRALELEPSYALAEFDLGLTLKELGQIEEATTYLEKADLATSRPLALECLLDLKRYDDFFAMLNVHKDIDRANLRTAAISAYASNQLARDDPHPFCPDPIGHIRVVDDLVGADGTAEFLSQILDEVGARSSVYEPLNVTTRGGYQTGGNLFDNPSGALAKLNEIFKEKISNYYDEIKSEQTIMVREWPRELNLRGWYVRYLNKGYQGGHIHPYGWLTCVIYLSMPEKVPDPSEGGIKFTLKDDNYPDILDDVPSLFHVPVNGQIVLFPSSLYHYTVPVTSGEERLMIASDLLPDAPT
jgi:tetratricopeptide (TPR) repeat protein